MPGKVERIDKNLIKSGMTFALVITGDVPPGVKETDVASWCIMQVACPLAFQPFMRTANVITSKDDPAALAARLTDAAGSALVK